jgi:hypothetical protein
VHCGLQLVSNLFAFPGRRLGERDADVGDHSGDQLHHRLYRNVVAVDAGVDEAVQ